MTREEQWLAGIAAGMRGDDPLPEAPHEAVWHYEQMLAAIYDAAIGADPARPFPPCTWNLDRILYAVYCLAAGQDDPGCPEPTCRIETFWRGIYERIRGDDGASASTPVWRTEAFLADVFDAAENAGGSVLTVAGNAPLTLPNAAAKGIRRLTQHGFCTQTGTPAPGAPADICCNNGVLKAVDDELPAGYRRLLGFSMNNDCYWQIAGFRLRGSDTLRFSFSASGACNVIGCYTTTSAQTNFSLYCQAAAGARFMRYNGGTYPSAIATNTRYDVTMTPTGATGLPEASAWEQKTFEAESDLCVGTVSTAAASSKFKGSLFGNIEVDGRLKLVPCERVSDGALGYFDLVGEAFHVPEEGTPSSLGYDGLHDRVAAVGTAETLTVTHPDGAGETASAVDLFSVGGYADEQEIIDGTVTRNVGAAVLTGQEPVSTENGVYIIGIAGKKALKTEVICSHYPYSSATGATAPDKSIQAFDSVYVGIKDSDWTDAAAFKAFLAAQYAAGTPVILIYPLATADSEHVAAQQLHAARGTNTLGVTAAVGPVGLACEYREAR